MLILLLFATHVLLNIYNEKARLTFSGKSGRISREPRAKEPQGPLDTSEPELALMHGR